jgi:hypothetical protein
MPFCSVVHAKRMRAGRPRHKNNVVELSVHCGLAMFFWSLSVMMEGKTSCGGRSMPETKDRMHEQGEIMERRLSAALEFLNSIRKELESKK